MGKVNKCLTRGFMVLISLIGIISGLLLAITLFGHGYFYQTEEIDELIPGITILYALGATTFLLSLVGLFGASGLRKWALVVFAIGMTLTSVAMFIETMRAIPTRHQGTEEMRREYMAMLPLSNASNTDKADLFKLQSNFECCGIEVGYDDWGHDIPNSCLCAEDAVAECVKVPENSSVSESSDQYVHIYSRPCLPVLISKVLVFIDIMLVILVGLTLIWMLSAVLCIVMLYQLFRKEDPLPPVVYSAQAKEGNYSMLSEETI